MRDGGLRRSVTSSIGTKRATIVYRKIYAKFLYYGKVMVGVVTRRPWAKKGEIKETVNRDLTYSRGGSHWFEEAKKENMKNWLEVAKKAFQK